MWFELTSDDLAAAKKFYQDMFGWEMNEMGGYMMYQAVAAKELHAGIKENPVKGHIPSHWTPYVSVENTKAATAKAKKLGAIILHITHDTTNGIVSIVLNPTGAPLAFWKIKSGKK